MTATATTTMKTERFDWFALKVAVPEELVVTVKSWDALVPNSATRPITTPARFRIAAIMTWESAVRSDARFS